MPGYRKVYLHKSNLTAEKGSLKNQVIKEKYGARGNQAFNKKGSRRKVQPPNNQNTKKRMTKYKNEKVKRFLFACNRAGIYSIHLLWGQVRTTPTRSSAAQRTKLFMDSCEEPPITRSRRKGEFKKRTSPQMTKTGRA